VREVIVDVATIVFDSKLFSADAIKQAAYRLARDVDTEIHTVGSEIVCELRNRNNADLLDLANAFRREVVDQDLRLQIRKQTEAVRNVILAHAFSRTGIISSE
jgi:His-Xaa-Ser system protein HxsD